MYDGNLSFLDDYEASQDHWLSGRPKCEKCGEPIQDDEMYETPEGNMCERCAWDLAYDLAEKENPGLEDCYDATEEIMAEWEKEIDWRERYD